MRISVYFIKMAVFYPVVIFPEEFDAAVRIPQNISVSQAVHPRLNDYPVFDDNRIPHPFP